MRDRRKPANRRDRVRPRGKHEKQGRKIDPVKGNPAIVRSAVVAVLALLASLGLGWAADVDVDLVTAVVVALLALAPIVAGVWTRPAVTPDVKVISRVTTDGEVVTGPAADLPVGTVLDSDVRPPVRAELVADPAHAMVDGVYVEDPDYPDEDPNML